MLNAELPDIEIVDMKQEDDLFFSKTLLEEIKNTLLRDEQVILLLNRKDIQHIFNVKIVVMLKNVIVAL